VKILVMGAGAIGSLVGGRLAAAGNDVVLVCRPAWARAVEAQGLVITEGEASIRVNAMRAVTEVEQVQSDKGGPRFDLIIISVKAHDTAEAAGVVLPLAHADVPVLVLQNGVGGDEIAMSVLGDTPLISATITLAVAVSEPGHIRVTTRSGGLGLASTVPGRDVTPFRELLQRAGFKVRTYQDYRAMRWSKLLLNIIANASPAILDMAPEEVFGHDRLCWLEMAAFREAVGVMRGLGLSPVPLPGYPVPLFAWVLRTLPGALVRPLFRRSVARGRGGKMPSLHIDLSRGRKRSEVEYLNGAVVRAARQLGVSVPANEALYSVLSGIVKGAIPWEDYRGKPEALLERVGE